MMFDNYDNLSKHYKPYNLNNVSTKVESYTALNPIESSKPYEEYNVKGELIGYKWYYGNSINLEFNIDGQVTVEDDAIIYYASGEKPLNTTRAHIGQRCYNVKDLVSWTCTAVVNTLYTWTMDEEFTYPNTTNYVYVSAEDYIKDKTLRLTFFDFRMRVVHEVVQQGNTTMVVDIDSELSQKFVKGVYYCRLDVFNNNINDTIFDVKDCVFNVI